MASQYDQFDLSPRDNQQEGDGELYDSFQDVPYDNLDRISTENSPPAEYYDPNNRYPVSSLDYYADRSAEDQQPAAVVRHSAAENYLLEVSEELRNFKVFEKKLKNF